MRKIITFIILISLIACPAFAYNMEVFDETELGAKVDAPNLIQITENCSVGVEAGVYDLHEDWKDSSYAAVKFTYTGSLINLTK
jgi:hypothetical protein